jgi:hypothetical protein
MTETYIKAVSNLADSSVAAARLATDLMQVVMDSNRESISLAQNNTKALSRYMVESARAIEEEVRRQPPFFRPYRLLSLPVIIILASQRHYV